MDPNQQPQYTQAPTGQRPSNAPASEDPGKTMAILGIVLGIIINPIIGLVLSIMANNRSKKAGFQNNSLAKVGLWINGVLLVLFVLVVVLVIISLAASGKHSSV